MNMSLLPLFFSYWIMLILSCQNITLLPRLCLSHLHLLSFTQCSLMLLWIGAESSEEFKEKCWFSTKHMKRGGTGAPWPVCLFDAQYRKKEGKANFSEGFLQPTHCLASLARSSLKQWMQGANTVFYSQSKWMYFCRWFHTGTVLLASSGNWDWAQLQLWLCKYRNRALVQMHLSLYQFIDRFGGLFNAPKHSANPTVKHVVKNY